MLHVAGSGTIYWQNEKLETTFTEELIKRSIKVQQELLKKAGVTKEDIKLKITFDLTIVLQKGKEYKATIYLDLPVGDVIEEGTTSEEITNTKDFIFKRVNN